MKKDIPKKGVTILLFAVLTALTVLLFAAALPVGPSITIIENSTISSNPEMLNHSGGHIYFSSITATQQNYGWKAYIGNISGSFTLDDAHGYTIYDWALNASLIDGEIYAARNSSIDWTYLACANDSVILQETQHFGFGLYQEDNINNTFNYSKHKAMTTATSVMLQNTCPSTWLYVNNSRQPIETTDVLEGVFQQILIQDRNFNLIYATFIEKDAYNYQSTDDKNITADFQMIIPENKTKSDFTAYYFYVEIG